MILILSSLNALLGQLVSPEGAPHIALLISRSNGSVIAQQQANPSHLPPFPPPSLLGDRDDEERARLYAAVGSSTWDEEDAASRKGALMLETELGRIAIIALGGFLLILVGSEVAPWPVLEKKIALAREVLEEPLQRVGQ